jgi:branched-chain amino acid transport system permease protein
MVTWGLPFVVALVAVTAFMAALGLGIHYGVMRKLVGQPFFSLVLVTIGIAIVIRALVLVIYGPIERGRVQSLPQGQFELLGARIQIYEVIILASVTVIVIAFYSFFRFTRTGLHMRAVAENLEAAAAMGINPDRVYALAWAIGMGMAGVAGVFYSQFAASIDLNLAAIGLRAAPAAIVGGLDSVEGAIVGGLVVGLVEAIGAGYLGSQYRDVLAFGVLFLFLLVRPSGLFGTKELERV